uniref:Ig-like domain-containing protein n=1 Tax=Catharus ustulatus TaxID=91951 RepID=A0A8C3Y8C4_CATUS
MKSNFGWIKPNFGWIKPSFGWIKPNFGWIKPSFSWMKPNFGWMKPNFGWIKPSFGWIKPIFVWIKPNFGWIKPNFAWIKPNFTWIKPHFEWIKPNYLIPAVAPDSAVFPKHPVLQDEPNILICSVTKFWPPVLGLSWLKNGAPVEEGVLETPFYPDRDNTFRKFSYLPFIPEPGDYYDCKVEHEALGEPRITHWEPQIQAPASEATETVICALGLAVGIVGIAAGTALIIRGMKLGRARAERGVL